MTTVGLIFINGGCFFSLILLWTNILRRYDSNIIESVISNKFIQKNNNQLQHTMFSKRRRRLNGGS